MTISAFASTPAKIPAIECGGRTITDIANLKILWAVVDTATRQTGFIESNGTTNYVVPGSTTLRIFCYKLLTNNTANFHTGTIGYGDDSTGVDDAALPATPIYMFARDGGTTSASRNSIVLLQQTAAVVAEDDGLALNFTVPTGKFPFLKTSAAASWGMVIYAKEE